MSGETRWGDAGGDILADIAAAAKLLDTFPPPPFYASSTMFARDRAVSFTVDRRTYLGAHPDTWAKVPVKEALGNPLFAAPIHNLDADPKDRQQWADALHMVWPRDPVEVAL